MDTGLGMEGGTDGHRTRDGRWDRWTRMEGRTIDTGLGWKVGQMDTGLGIEGGTDKHRVGQMDTGLGMEGGTDGHRTRDGRWDRWTQD